MKYVAVYRDQDGAAFSCPVTKLSTGQWVLATANGPREISFYIYGNDVAGGFLTFSGYRIDGAPPKLRGCDVVQLLNRMYKTLPWPQKPPAPQIPQTPPEPEDYRLHVEQGPDPFRVLQEAGAKGEMEYRASRQQARREMLNNLNRPDSQKLQDARRINREFADIKRPRGKGAAFIIGKGE